MAHIKVHSDARKTPLESDHANFHALISWRAILGGILVAMLTMLGFVGLGFAFGGMGLSDGSSMQAAGIFTGVWFIVSLILSLFVGSYFAARVSKFRTGRIGSAQGLVIASVVLGFFLYQTIQAIGTVGSAAGNVLQTSGSVVVQGAQQAANNQTVMNTVNNLTEDALGDLNLRSEPRVVAQGIATRLLRGDTEGARSYLVRQSGITEAEAQQRIDQLRNTLNSYIEDVRNATATALRSLGWSLFLMVVLGALAAVAGGALGSVANFRKPLIRESEGYYPPGHAV
ncbi:MAG: hypothetical protein ACLGHN_02190 [Bacteriovoracia bacterium]